MSKVTQIQHFQTSFPQKNTRPFEAKFHMEPPWDVGMKIYSNVPGHMAKMASRPIYQTRSNMVFFGTQGQVTPKSIVRSRRNLNVSEIL